MKTAMERLQIVLDEANRHSGYSIPYFQLRDLAKSFAQELDGRGVGVPSGWRLVPIEPTLQMKQEGYRAIIAADKSQVYGEAIADRGYSAMLAASPTPPAAGQSLLSWIKIIPATGLPSNTAHVVDRNGKLLCVIRLDEPPTPEEGK